jgi:hypothetical protein
MAIPFSRLMAMRLTPLYGAVAPLAYTARTALYDPRVDTVFDFRHLDSDYACGGIILPEGHPVAFNDLGIFATSLDLAEFSKVRMPLEERERGIQVGLSLVVALPPKDQLWLHEATELLRWIATAPPRSDEVAIHWAIHEALINRHGHVWYALRTFDAAGNAGPKVRDFMVHHRGVAWGPEIVEGVHWPSLTWEVQQAYFEELGLDLVVDPIAPVPGKHYAPVVHVQGTIPEERTRERIARARARAHAANVKAIRDRPEELIETLLRGRSTLRILELERLCTRFFDHPADRTANVERILADEDIVTLADDDAEKPRYLTTWRIHTLAMQAAGLIDNSSKDEIATITAADRASLVRRIAEHHHARNHPGRPLILGQALSDCQDVAAALEADAPLVGTIDMAVTGSDDLLAIGRARDLALRVGRLVIVPHSERIDDQRLARLLQEANEREAQLILGHDQSRKHGVVHRHLAAYAADRTGATFARHGRDDIERLLRAGLVRHAIQAMADCGLLSFGELPDRRADDSSLFVICQGGRINELADTINKERVRAKTLEPPEQMTTLRGTLGFSVGEWIVTTQRCEDPLLEAGQFAQIVAIDRSNSTIEIMHDEQIKRINLEAFAAIRSTTTISIREARGLPEKMRLAVELTDHRRTWAALLLVARRNANARLYVDPALARSIEELTGIARRSLSGALPHQRAMKPDPDAEISKMLRAPQAEDQLEPQRFPEPRVAMPTPPRPIHLEERVRSAIASNVHAREGYRLLYRHVGHRNANRRPNAERILGLCTSDLTAALVRFLANLEPQRDRGELDYYDLPPELAEHDPARWTLIQIQNAKLDLQTMALPGSNWGFRPPLPLPPEATFDV